jgi:hypothetical protein
MDVVLFALYKLGGVSKKVHTEDIAWEAYKLAKEKFCWQLPEYRKREFPDKTIVYYALADAKKKKYGKLVVGKGGHDSGGELEGWRLTSEGVAWIKEREKRILEGLKEETPDLPKREAERFIKKIKGDQFFKYFQERHCLDDAPQYMFTDMLVCAPDAARNIIKQKFEQVCANAELVGDVEISDFLKACTEKFGDLIS